MCSSDLTSAADAGVTLFDTADVYGDGRSERLIGRFLRERRDPRLFVATKMGRRVPQEVANYTPEAFRAWIDRSRTNLGVERLDMMQIHNGPVATPPKMEGKYYAQLWIEHYTRKGGAIENLGLWGEAIRAAQAHAVRWEWVRGHDGHAQNEYANHLATTAASEQSNSGGLVESEFDRWLARARAKGARHADPSPFPDDATFKASPTLPRA